MRKLRNFLQITQSYLVLKSISNYNKLKIEKNFWVWFTENSYFIQLNINEQKVKQIKNSSAFSCKEK